ncbi:MAG: SprT-like domain-containing protein [Verrucomicrobiales bacterium]
MKFPQQLLLKLTALFEDAPLRTPVSPRPVGSQNGVSRFLPRGPDPSLTEFARGMVRRLRGLRGLGEKVRVVWNPRLQTTAGTANPRAWEVELNPRLKEHGPAITERILRHELAHLVSVYRAGRRKIDAHGAEWREACIDLGIPGEPRCHNLPFQGRRVKHKYTYRCLHCGRLLKRVKVLSRNSACYDCCQSHNRGRYDQRYRYVRVLVAMNGTEH